MHDAGQAHSRVSELHCCCCDVMCCAVLLIESTINIALRKCSQAGLQILSFKTVRSLRCSSNLRAGCAGLSMPSMLLLSPLVSSQS